MVQVRDDARLDRKVLFDLLRAEGVLVNVHYIPIHTQPYYAAMGFKQRDFPVAEGYYAHAISLPMFVGLSHGDQDRVIDILTKALAP